MLLRTLVHRRLREGEDAAPLRAYNAFWNVKTLRLKKKKKPIYLRSTFRPRFAAGLGAPLLILPR